MEEHIYASTRAGKLFIIKSEWGTDHDWWQVLHLACECGYIDIVTFLLDNGVNPNRESLYDTGPLHYACYSCHNEIVQRLIYAGANVCKKDSWGDTPLHDAIHGYAMHNSCGIDSLFSIINMLINSGADPNAVNDMGSAPEQLTRNYVIFELFERYRSMALLRAWRPWNHAQYGLSYRQAMTTLVVLAKAGGT